ncbi:hypothetical protein NA57DRAFT_57604 [Rhizodiscina lignyota]|uniref:Uncharacterized protein n=1 Tax=Rhizodiscina lignyota TaxID=1504668 RepID=A0A9P4IDG5_9PEZI|nr:hypothetical protein NA57DRAFT_57604 [Rhizodiscina lignyota]
MHAFAALSLLPTLLFSGVAFAGTTSCSDGVCAIVGSQGVFVSGSPTGTAAADAKSTVDVSVGSDGVSVPGATVTGDIVNPTDICSGGFSTLTGSSGIGVACSSTAGTTGTTSAQGSGSTSSVDQVSTDGAVAMVGSMGMLGGGLLAVAAML